MEQITKAVSLTFIHSIWQALLIYFAVKLALLLSERRSPVFRYYISFSGLVVFITGAAITFAAVLPAGGGLQPPGLSNSTSVIINSTAAGWSLLTWCAAHSNEICLVWLALFILKSIQTSVSILSIHHIARNATPVTPAWQQRLDQLSRGIALKKGILMKESKMVHQPLVAGFFKPVILLPLAMLTTLPPAETETILLHELAHIRRKDYLVNCMQAITTTIFFFNPAVTALSTLIRNEREFCCDAIAISASGDKKIFINALLSFARFHNESASAVLYANGNNAVTLTERVYRIIHGRYGKAGLPEKISSLLCLLAGIALMAFSTVPAKNPVAAPKAKTIPAITSAKEAQKKPASATYGKLSHGSTIGSYGKPVVSDNSLQKSIPRDTVPAGESQEFKDGYRAAQNYLNQPAGSDAKKQLETGLDPKKGGSAILRTNNDNQYKIELERLQQRKRII
ncbi:MAG: M56 family metallopeptidase [Chitinophagaceae bacterium]|nr:M56 family metallopeptidase [Chitinophagaceae bacterium]